jgi:hypothetical protein
MNPNNIQNHVSNPACQANRNLKLQHPLFQRSKVFQPFLHYVSSTAVAKLQFPIQGTGHTKIKRFSLKMQANFDKKSK